MGVNMRANFYGCDFGSTYYKKIDLHSVPFLRLSDSPNKREIVPEWMLPIIDTMAGESYIKIQINTKCDAIYFFGMINSNDIHLLYI